MNWDLTKGRDREWRRLTNGHTVSPWTSTSSKYSSVIETKMNYVETLDRSVVKIWNFFFFFLWSEKKVIDQIIMLEIRTRFPSTSCSTNDHVLTKFNFQISKIGMMSLYSVSLICITIHKESANSVNQSRTFQIDYLHSNTSSRFPERWYYVYWDSVSFCRLDQLYRESFYERELCFDIWIQTVRLSCQARLLIFQSVW